MQRLSQHELDDVVVTEAEDHHGPSTTRAGSQPLQGHPFWLISEFLRAGLHSFKLIFR